MLNKLAFQGSCADLQESYTHQSCKLLWVHPHNTCTEFGHIRWQKHVFIAVMKKSSMWVQREEKEEFDRLAKEKSQNIYFCFLSKDLPQEGSISI